MVAGRRETLMETVTSGQILNILHSYKNVTKCGI